MTFAAGLTRENGDPEKSESSNAWDVVVFADRLCPGVARVEARAPSALDFKKPKGHKGAIINDNGDPPFQMDITITLQPSEEEEFFQQIFPVLKPRSKSGGRAPLKFNHPYAERFGVQNIIIGEIKAPPPTPGGTMVIELEAFQWAPSTSEIGNNSKVQSANSGTAPGDRVVLDQVNQLGYTVSSLPDPNGQF